MFHYYTVQTFKNHLDLYQKLSQVRTKLERLADLKFLDWT